ncbi:MAG: choice-of-anchor Q domain-containing protein, partial [Thermoanaerobaculia bacterium]
MNDPRLYVSGPTRQQRRAEERREKKRNRRRGSDVAVGAALALGAVALASPASAATIVVNSTADTVANDDGQCTLREAINSANTDSASGVVAGECIAGSGADIIDLSSQSGTITLTGGSLDIQDSVDIEGPGPAILTVSGANNSRVFYAYQDTIFDVKIAGLTISDGNPGNGQSGGAIFASYVNLTLDNDVIKNNYAFYDGGGVYFYGRNNTKLNIANCIISGNYAGDQGGGVYAGEASNGTVITNTTIGDPDLSDANDEGNYANGAGGGLFFRGGGYLNVSNSSISGNSAYYGGGVYMKDEGYDSTFDNTRIQQNKAYYDGGGIFAYSPSGTMSIINGSLVDDNSTATGNGGGINFSSGPGSLVVNASSITNNYAYAGGGGVFAANLDLGSSVTIQGATITGNTAAYKTGGGLYLSARYLQGVALTNAAPSRESTLRKRAGATVSGPGASSSAPRRSAPNAVPNAFTTVLIEDSNLSKNTNGGGWGGALYAHAIGDLTIRRSTISGNSATKGGGGAQFDTCAGIIENSTIANNTVNGGGLFNNVNNGGGGLWIGDSDIGIAESTISGNTADNKGGGVLFYFYHQGVATIGPAVVGDGSGSYVDSVHNSIIAQNTAPADADLSTFTSANGTTSSAITASFTLIGDTGAATFTDGGGNILGNSTTPANPLLGPLANNGGPTETMLPQAGSPVIDTGDPDTTGLPATDQRGLPRVANGRVDMGSVEVQAAVGDFTFSAPVYSGVEGGNASITVNRVNGSAGAASVTVAVTGGTATSGADYTFAGTTLNFADGEITQTFTFPLTADGTFDPGETINLALQSPTGGANLGTQTTSVVTIN